MFSVVNIAIAIAILIGLATAVGFLAISVALVIEVIRSIIRWRQGYDY